MAKIFAQSEAVDISGSITAWVISGDTITIIATSFNTSNTSSEGDVVIIEATDTDGKMYIPLYANAPARFEGPDGQYPNQWRWILKYDNELYDLTGTSFTINDAQWCDSTSLTNEFTLPNSCAREEVFTNAVYGVGMKSYNTTIVHSLIIPRYIFNVTKFKKIYKNMGEYMIYTDSNKEYAYKIVTTEETIFSLNDVSRRGFKFKLPTR